MTSPLYCDITAILSKKQASCLLCDHGVARTMLLSLFMTNKTIHRASHLLGELCVAHITKLVSKLSTLRTLRRTFNQASCLLCELCVAQVTKLVSKLFTLRTLRRL